MCIVEDAPVEKLDTAPPKVLVSTWLQILKANRDIEAVKRAQDMIVYYFNDLESFLAYCRAHKIKVE